MEMKPNRKQSFTGFATYLLLLAEMDFKVLRRYAYKRVFKELSRAGLFSGHYSGNESGLNFMYGVLTVMDLIAYQAGGKELEGKFSDEFIKNMNESEEENGSD